MDAHFAGSQLLGTFARLAPTDHACVPNASPGAIPAVIPKVGLAPGAGVWIDNDPAVFLRDLPPHDVIGKLLLDLSGKIYAGLAGEFIDLFGALQETDMAGNIAPELARKSINILRVSQEKYSRRIKEGHRVSVAEGFEAELNTLAPSFPAPVNIKPESIRLGMSALRIAPAAEFDRIRCPVIVRHVAWYRSSPSRWLMKIGVGGRRSVSEPALCSSYCDSDTACNPDSLR